PATRSSSARGLEQVSQISGLQRSKSCSTNSMASASRGEWKVEDCASGDCPTQSDDLRQFILAISTSRRKAPSAECESQHSNAYPSVSSNKVKGCALNLKPDADFFSEVRWQLFHHRSFDLWDRVARAEVHGD